MALPIVLHQDADEVRVAIEPDAHQVPRLALVPVGGGPDRYDAGHRLAVIEPHLNSDARAAVPQCQQVVVEREAPGLRLGELGETLRARDVQIPTVGRADVPGYAALTPAEIVGRGDVREEVEAELLAEVLARLDEALPLDDERRLAVRLPRLDESRDVAVCQLATPRISYAGGRPACTFSCSRMIPSISASGRGGQPGTWMSTATILSTPWSTA
jgi:hypothetical protein